MTSLRLASALGVAALLLSACGTDPSAAPTPAATPPVPATSAAEPAPNPTTATTPSAGESAETPAKGTIITPTPNVVRSSADAAQATTPELRAFLEGQINELTAGCTDYPRPELILSEMRVDDLITGEVRECGGGGAAFLWAKVDGDWKVAAVAQAPPTCRELRDAGITTPIPDNFVGHECMTDDGQMVIFVPNG